MNTRICKKCLLRDLPQEETFRTMREYIANLPEEDKVEESVYEERLKTCVQCEKFLAGMCRICGCYVEMRAAMKVRHCPGIPSHW